MSSIRNYLVKNQSLSTAVSARTYSENMFRTSLHFIPYNFEIFIILLELSLEVFTGVKSISRLSGGKAWVDENQLTSWTI